MSKIAQKFTGFVFGEGRRDKKFLIALIELPKFKYHTKRWEFKYGNGHGCSAGDVLKECKKRIRGQSYDLVICFIDLDDLKHDYSSSWEEKRQELEDEYSDFEIVWFIDNAEDEFVRVLGERCKSKRRLNSKAIDDVQEFINSDLWNRILNPIKAKEAQITQDIDS